MDDLLSSECIYNLLPRPAVPPRLRLKYFSKQRQMVQEEWENKKSSYKTMGLPKVEPPCPRHHLLKHSKEPRLPERQPYKVPVDGIKSYIPTDKPLMGLRSKKNFVETNIADVKVSVPRKPVPIYVDTRRGNKNLLEPSGLLPTLLHRKGLKQNWEELNHSFQGLSILIDTVSKQNHKERLETKMKKLEQDIDLIERHKFIYIPQQ
ncbi:enkurin isoform X3 [Rhinoraja longicauda]